MGTKSRTIFTRPRFFRQEHLFQPQLGQTGHFSSGRVAPHCLHWDWSMSFDPFFASPKWRSRTRETASGIEVTKPPSVKIGSDPPIPLSWETSSFGSTPLRRASEISRPIASASAMVE